MNPYIYTSDGPEAKQAADLAGCNLVMEVLQKHYPDHPWLIGCDHQAGVVHVKLAYTPKNYLNTQNYGFLLHLSKVLGSDGPTRIMRAGGETLERYKLERGRADDQSAAKAHENGINLDGIIRKSRY